MVASALCAYPSIRVRRVMSGFDAVVAHRGDGDAAAARFVDDVLLTVGLRQPHGRM
jgi:hypothetical protein